MRTYSFDRRGFGMSNGRGESFSTTNVFSRIIGICMTRFLIWKGTRQMCPRCSFRTGWARCTRHIYALNDQAFLKLAYRYHHGYGWRRRSSLDKCKSRKSWHSRFMLNQWQMDPKLVKEASFTVIMSMFPKNLLRNTFLRETTSTFTIDCTLNHLWI